ncbi:MAG: hypothetical protein AB1758_32735, partial [Candidatus Eremiobacterota bacterium]
GKLGPERLQAELRATPEWRAIERLQRGERNQLFMSLAAVHPEDPGPELLGSLAPESSMADYAS